MFSWGDEDNLAETATMAKRIAGCSNERLPGNSIFRQAITCNAIQGARNQLLHGKAGWR
jgi:hypothetical protein